MSQSPPVASLPEGRRLKAISFVNTVSFDSKLSLSIGVNCLSIVPARLDPDGSAIELDKGQRADGVLIRIQKGQPTPRIERHYVPWANIADLIYGE